MWTCPNCQEVMEDQFAGSCWRCAENNPQPNANVESDVRDQPAVSVVDVRYKGVKGWLLLLCVIITILTPLNAIVAGIIDFIIAANPSLRYSNFSYSQSRNISTLLTVDGFILLGMACFSFISGLTLWMEKRYAPKLVKILLLTAFIRTVINLPLFQAFNVPTNQLVVPIIVTGFWGFIWYMYLISSKRVRATYYYSEAA